MDWATYRSLCDQGNVLSRYLLACTIDLLAAADEALLAQELQQVLVADPLPKPADHRAGAAADFFIVELEPVMIRRILTVVLAARKTGRPLGGFAEAWQEFLDWQTGVHPRSPGNRVPERQ